MAICSSISFAAILSCSQAQDVIKTQPPNTEFSYDFPLADYSAVAQQLIDLSPNGIAIGELHGQLAGILLLEDIVRIAQKTYPSVLVLIEVTPQELDLNIDDVSVEGFQTFDISDPSLPFWNDNIDKRATHELRLYLSKITNEKNVEQSYLWDSRLNPPPNALKAHGFAKRWEIAKAARPNAYIVALAGNYHTSVNHDYPLNETNSMCRYADEKLDIKLTCIAVESHGSKNNDCKDNQTAILQRGSEVYEDWHYVIRRPDRCLVEAHWVNEPQ